MAEDIKILDHRGNPLRRKTLTREVAAPRMTGVRSMWGIDSVASSITPDSLVALLQNAANGDHQQYLTLAEEMEERELHYASVLSTRKLAISGLPVVVEAASDDAKDIELADEVRELTRRPEFGEMLDNTLDALGKGYSANEIMWDRSERQWWPRDYEYRDPRFFRFDPVSGRDLQLLDDNGSTSTVLPAYKFIVHKPAIKSGLPIRGGLARLACVGYMCKAYTVKDWMAFAEVFGMPLRIGRYSPNASQDDINTLINAVANIGTDAAAVMPDGMRIEFEQAGNGAGGDKLFLALAEWWDKQISKGVLGQTMTADDGSSQSQANVHNEVRGDILVSDARKLSNTLNRDLVEPFIDLNHGPQKAYPRLILQVTEPEDIEALTNALETLVPLGLRVEESVIRDRLGLPDPREGEDVILLKAPQTASMPPVEMDTATNHSDHHCPSCAKARNAQDDVTDTIDDLMSDPLDDWEEQLKPVIDPIIKLAEESESYDEFIAALPSLLGEMDSTEMIKRLALETFKARGMGDATDGVS